MACTVSLVCLVSTVVATTKTHSKKQVQVAGTKQSKQENRAVRATLSVSGMPALFCARYQHSCFVKVDV
jgi:hypothetical protein